MLDLLAKIFGPQRAVSVYVVIRRFWIPVALFFGFLAVFGFIVTASDPDRMEHIAYLRVEVVEVTPLTQDINSGVFVDVRLPEGEVLKLTETEGAISRELTDVACLERRRDRETGEISHRLRRAHRCAG
ncbi:hypothetical protein [Aestuariivita boseongensis]|uniref:hypothetical protein n=1 Tax=Aestuariivita boseongensis TaxID=1470562 RepID=UPI000680BC2A|nr:hypothetical protein [Aestuariivita boseongensis]